MTPVSQHQRCPQARTSITNAGLAIGGAQMKPCASQWLKQVTGSGCLA
jgi:hypothetical protein